MKNLKSSNLPHKTFKGVAKINKGTIESLFMMQDAFGRFFLSDPFFKPSQRWIEIEPKSLTEKKF